MKITFNFEDSDKELLEDVLQEYIEMHRQLRSKYPIPELQAQIKGKIQGADRLLNALMEAK